MGYKLTFYSQGEGVVNKGTSFPSWFNNYNDKSKWWNDNNPITNFFYSIVNENDTYIQYGKNYSHPDVTWASARFFGEKVEVLNSVENSDSSITVSLRVTPSFFVIRKTDFASGGLAVRYTIKIHEKTVFSYTGNTTDEITQTSIPSESFTITIPPNTISLESALSIMIHYPNGEYDDQKIIIGLGVENTNPPTYIPNMVVKNNTRYPLNKVVGKNIVRKNNNEKDISLENATTIGTNNGHNRVVKNNVSRQALKYE